MKGLIMDYPLTLTQFFERTRKLFHKKTLATRVPGVGLQRYTYADYADRVCRLLFVSHSHSSHPRSENRSASTAHFGGGQLPPVLVRPDR